MSCLEPLKNAIIPLITELENFKYELIHLIEINIIKGNSALKPMTNLVLTQIANLTNFLRQLRKLIE